jgi:hypothetical protein
VSHEVEKIDFRSGTRCPAKLQPKTACPMAKEDRASFMGHADFAVDQRLIQ